MFPTKLREGAAPTERGEETRRRILEAAAAAFAEAGYRGTSLNDVIRRSGLTKGAFYFHFPSKEQLALEVFQAKQDSWYQTVTTALVGRSRALDQLAAMHQASIKIHSGDPSARAISRLCFELSEDPALAPQLTPFFTTWFDVLHDTLRRAQAEGDVRGDVDVEKVAYVAVAGFIGMQDMSFLLTRSADMPQRAQDLFDVILMAITA